MIVAENYNNSRPHAGKTIKIHIAIAGLFIAVVQYIFQWMIVEMPLISKTLIESIQFYIIMLLKANCADAR